MTETEQAPEGPDVAEDVDVPDELVRAAAAVLAVAMELVTTTPPTPEEG